MLGCNVNRSHTCHVRCDSSCGVALYFGQVASSATRFSQTASGTNKMEQLYAYFSTAGEDTRLFGFGAVEAPRLRRGTLDDVHEGAHERMVGETGGLARVVTRMRRFSVHRREKAEMVDSSIEAHSTHAPAEATAGTDIGNKPARLSPLLPVKLAQCKHA
jgi:hypothetical protein